MCINLCQPGNGIIRKLYCAQAAFHELFPTQLFKAVGEGKSWEALMVMAVTISVEVRSKAPLELEEWTFLSGLVGA